MNKAFTMFELIFVIVILGILAAVAIPKLAATRDDAQIVKTTANIKTAISEIMTTTLAKGALDANITAMSQALETMVSNGTATELGNKFNIKIGAQADCVVLDINSSNEIIVDVHYSRATDGLCQSFQDANDLDKYALKIRGANVTY